MKWNLTKIYGFFGGVTEFYAFVFTTVSIYMALKGILTPTFVAAIGAIQAFVTANDVHNDLNVNRKLDDIHADVNALAKQPLQAPADPDDDDLPGGPH
jgi:hypothetical protein